MKLSKHDLDLMYREMLDDVCGTVSIAGYEYQTSRALSEVDPTVYRCGFNDWLDSCLNETIWEQGGEYFDSEPANEGEAS